MNYSAVNAKVKGMKGNLLKYEDYVKLSNISNVIEFGEKLREIRAYKDICENSNSNIKVINSIESKLDLTSLDNFIKISKFIYNVNIKKYLKFIESNNKFKFIKYIIFSLYDKNIIKYDKDEIKKIFLYDKNINIEKMISSKNINDFIESLKDNEIYKILSKNYNEKFDLLSIKLSIDLYYYMHLWKLQSKLDKKNRNIAKIINGTEIDVQNINIIYRLKKYYNLNKDLIYTYLIPVNYYLSKEKIIKMVESKTIEELENEIFKTYYGKYFNNNLNLEKTNDIILKDTYDKITSFNRNSIAVILDYIFYNNIEIKNLIKILECIRYKFTSDEIMKYIIIK